MPVDSLRDSMKSRCRSDSFPVAAFFCRITRSLPTSVPACSVKRFVRQPDGRYGLAAVHQPLAHGASLLGVQYSLRGDECHQAALAYHIDGLHEKIVGAAPVCLAAARVGMGGEERVEERHVPERDVAHGHVVVNRRIWVRCARIPVPAPVFRGAGASGSTPWRGLSRSR